MSDQQRDHTTAQQLGHGLEVAKRYVDEGTLIVETAFQDDGVEMRVPAQHVAECLVDDNDTGSNGPTGSLMIELLDDAVDQPRDMAKEPAVVAKEGAQRLRQGEHELAMRQVQKHLLSEMLGK